MQKDQIFQDCILYVAKDISQLTWAALERLFQVSEQALEVNGLTLREFKRWLLANPAMPEYTRKRLCRQFTTHVADACLLDPAAGTVGLDKFSISLWVAYSDQDEARVKAGAPVIRVAHRGLRVGAAMAYLKKQQPGITKDDVLFLVSRVKFIGRFTAGAGTTCGEWTRIINAKGDKGFFKASVAGGWCPARCSFCYLLKMPFRHQALALNVGDFANQVAREYAMGHKSCRIPILNFGETGGLLETCDEFGASEIVQAYIDATRKAGVVPYLLTKRAISSLRLDGAHVGISLNPADVMLKYSPGASTPIELLAFLTDAKNQGASTLTTPHG